MSSSSWVAARDCGVVSSRGCVTSADCDLPSPAGSNSHAGIWAAEGFRADFDQSSSAAREKLMLAVRGADLPFKQSAAQQYWRKPAGLMACSVQ